MGSDHVSGVSIEYVGILMDCAGVFAPLFLLGEGSHVVTDTGDLLLGQPADLGGDHNGLFTVSLEEHVLAVDEVAGLVLYVLVALAQIMEEADDVRRLRTLPVKIKIFGHEHEDVGHVVGMLAQSAGVVAVILGAGGGIEEAFGQQNLFGIRRTDTLDARPVNAVEILNVFFFGQTIHLQIL